VCFSNQSRIAIFCPWQIVKSEDLDNGFLVQPKEIFEFEALVDIEKNLKKQR
jgi:hypothetical protein